MDSPATTTRSHRAARAWKWASAAADQSAHRVGSMSSTAVPWPGSSGSSTVKPAAAQASASGAQGLGIAGEPVEHEDAVGAAGGGPRLGPGNDGSGHETGCYRPHRAGTVTRWAAGAPREPGRGSG